MRQTVSKLPLKPQPQSVGEAQDDADEVEDIFKRLVVYDGRYLRREMDWI